MQYNSYSNSRSINRESYRRQTERPKKNQKGFTRVAILMAIVGVLVWLSSSIIGIGQVQADANQPEILSGIPGYCLDVHHSGTKAGTPIDTWQCNGTHAQSWQISRNRILNRDKYCLDTLNSKVILNRCTNSPSESWSRKGIGIINNSTHLCLSLPGGKTNKQLIIASCNNLNSLSELWTPSQWTGVPLNRISTPSCNQKLLGQRVACFAQRQWVAWQTEPKIHLALLSDYTDSNPYEEWCADFVSYVYMEAGAPFTNGERNGWDQYNANDIQYMGFSYHQANSGYIPKAGDVAYFNYAGGHVEIVSKGGLHPTFIYGDSGVKDPVTGNGNMAENQITSDGSNGHLVYYLSPIN